MKSQNYIYQETKLSYIIYINDSDILKKSNLSKYLL